MNFEPSVSICGVAYCPRDRDVGQQSIHITRVTFCTSSRYCASARVGGKKQSERDI